MSGLSRDQPALTALVGEPSTGLYRALSCQFSSAVDRFVPLGSKAVFAASGPGLLPNLVETSFGYHIIYVQPFDAVKDDVLTLVKSQPGPLMATGLVVNTDVQVDPAYGVWSTAAGAIVAG